ncbi:MAG: hypothetical protein AB8E15_11965 [Bdellovibrionales bacterium]
MERPEPRGKNSILNLLKYLIISFTVIVVAAFLSFGFIANKLIDDFTSGQIQAEDFFFGDTMEDFFMGVFMDSKIGKEKNVVVPVGETSTKGAISFDNLPNTMVLKFGLIKGDFSTNENSKLEYDCFLKPSESTPPSVQMNTNMLTGEGILDLSNSNLAMCSFQIPRDVKLELVSELGELEFDGLENDLDVDLGAGKIVFVMDSTLNYNIIARSKNSQTRRDLIVDPSKMVYQVDLKVEEGNIQLGN